ncbi:MAG: YitT family protein [Bacteroidia bacterium]
MSIKTSRYNRVKSIIKSRNETYVKLRHELIDVFYLLLGVACATFGIKGFLIPNEFIDGGVMGISLIIYNVSGLSLPILVLIINVPFVLMAFKTTSARFAIKSILGISILSLALYLVPIPTIASDNILVAVFGGLFLGSGIGFAIRGGSIIDGTEVLAIFLSRKTNTTVGTIILFFNIIIFAVSAYVLSVEIALYAILTYFIASRTVDFIIDGVEEYLSVTIISRQPEKIRDAIVNHMGHGCTLLKGKTGFADTQNGHSDTLIVYTIITRLEISKLKTEVDCIDPNAFMVMTSVKDTKGGMVRKRVISKIK